MTSSPQNEYYLDSVSTPSETLLESLDAIGISQAELARRMGRLVKTINEIVREKQLLRLRLLYN